MTVWAEVRERFGVDLRLVGEPGCIDVCEAWALVERLLGEQGSATWAAVEGDPSLTGYTVEVMAAEQARLTAVAIAQAQAGHKPDRTRTVLEESRHRRRGQIAAQQGAEAVAAFLGLPIGALEFED